MVMLELRSQASGSIADPLVSSFQRRLSLSGLTVHG
jgi:hypothetical protein